MSSLTQKFLAALGVVATICSVTPVFAELAGQERDPFLAKSDHDGTVFFVPVNKNTQVACLAVADNVMLHQGPEYEKLVENHNKCISRVGKQDGGLQFNSVAVTCEGSYGVMTRLCVKKPDGTIQCATSSPDRHALKMK